MIPVLDLNPPFHQVPWHYFDHCPPYLAALCYGASTGLLYYRFYYHLSDSETLFWRFFSMNISFNKCLSEWLSKKEESVHIQVHMKMSTCSNVLVGNSNIDVTIVFIFLFSFINISPIYIHSSGSITNL